MVWQGPRRQTTGGSQTCLSTWLTMTERLVRIAKRENKKRPRSSMIMHRFLGLPQENNQENTRNTIRNNPRAYPQEMNPDLCKTPCPQLSAVSGSIIQIG
jgi:hypothetical protein